MTHIPIPMLLVIAVLGPVALGVMIAIQPEIGASLGVSPQQTQYALSSAFFMLGCSYLFAGKIIDRIGYQQALSVSGGCFCLSLLLGATASSYEMFVTARTLQALSGSFGFVVVRAHFFQCFDEKKATQLLGCLVVVSTLCPMFAPMFGSYMVKWFGWRFLYWSLFGLSAVLYMYIYSVRANVVGRLPSEVLSGYVQKSIWGEFNVRFVLSALSSSLASGVFFTFIAVGPSAMLNEFAIDGEGFGLLYVMPSIAFASAGFYFGRKAASVPFEKFFYKSVFVSMAGLVCMWLAIAYKTIFGYMVSMMILNFGNGLLVPAMCAYVFIHIAQSPPLASGLLGFIQMTIAGGVSFVAIELASETLQAMGLMMSVCIILSCIFTSCLVLIFPSGSEAV